MTTTFRIDDGFASHVGLVRSENEDSHFANADRCLWLVADGMGGFSNGKRASQALAEAIDAAPVAATLDEACAVISAAIHAVNQTIHDEAREGGVQMGSTVVVLLVRGDEFVVLWAGDSRAYLFRHGELIQLTRDHSQVQDMVDRGVLAPAEAADHPMKHVLSRAVGVQPTLEIDAIRDGVLSHDLFLLCSDGLHGMIGDDRIAAILREFGPAASEPLIAACLAAGASDNVTVALVELNDPTQLILEPDGA